MSFQKMERDEARIVTCSRVSTLWDSTECTQEVSSLAVLSIGILQHAEEESKFTSQTILSGARLSNMSFGEGFEKRAEE